MRATDDIKQSKINTLIQQYALFYMEDGETISSIQLRFTHIVNKLQKVIKKIAALNMIKLVNLCLSLKRNL